MEGRCFQCQETGNVSHQCPWTHNIQEAQSSHGLLGIPVHDIDNDLDVLHVGCMGLVEDPNNQGASTGPAKAGLISFYMTACENVLNLDHTLHFPGDWTFPLLGPFWNENWFSIMQISDNKVVVGDHLQVEHYEYLPIKQLKNPWFHIIHWLVVQVAWILPRLDSM
ncbi:hypothetical protein BDN71DRAFT_1432677 [Pleurotus eryngii]|uniref:CCHC-type domain-containing protein n=1 Tax=Pleurotus eryngii TaxID=5323 RepID=A0A9P6D5A3_PLEER|nr:hypothetical protein BDN71DRAFT_1432677 [Pleurotus eryngii]